MVEYSLLMTFIMRIHMSKIRSSTRALKEASSDFLDKVEIGQNTADSVPGLEQALGNHMMLLVRVSIFLWREVVLIKDRPRLCRSTSFQTIQSI